MDDWLRRASDRIANAVNDDASIYDLSQPSIDELLDLARVAAHDSGARTNAPLLAYLIGVAVGRHPQSSLEVVAEAVRGTAS